MTRNPQNPDLDERFAEFYDGLCSKLKRIMRTKSDVIVHSGEAILGLEAAVASLVEPGEKVLTVTSGVYGDGFIDFVKMYGGVPVEVRAEYDEVVSPEDVERTLEKEEVGVATLVHCETPSGTLNPLEEVGKICKEHDVILVVDAVSSVGGVPVEVDGWGVDVCIVGSQKCLSAPPGLGVTSVSKRAWEKMEERRGKARGFFYLDILTWREWWLEKRVFPYTQPFPLLYALDEACSLILEEGLENVFRRHEVVARAAREGVKAMGLKLFPKKEEYCSATVTAVEAPKGVREEELRRRMREKYGVMIAGSWGKLAGRVFRLGHMGYNAQPGKLLQALLALGRALSDMGFPSKTREALSAAEGEL